MAEKKEHPNAMLLRWIADGEEIEFNRDGNWYPATASGIIADVARNFDFKLHGYTYRIKPKTIRIGKHDVAEPMKEAPKDGTEYFWLDPRSEPGIDNYSWHDDAMDKELLARGCIWLKKEDAELAAKAIKELLTGQ